MKWIAVIEAMTASGYRGWSCVATLDGLLFPGVSTSEYSYFTALRQDYSAHPFHHRRFPFCGVTRRRPSAAWREAVNCFWLIKTTGFPLTCRVQRWRQPPMGFDAAPLYARTS